MTTEKKKLPYPSRRKEVLPRVRIYDRLQSESEESFAAFQAYRDSGPTRTIAKTAAEVGKSPDMSGKWAAKYHWVERARAWDAEVDRQRTEGALDAVREMRKRQINIAVSMQQLAATELLKLARKARAEGEDVVLSPDLILKLAKEGAALERLVRGESTEITDIRLQVQTIDYTKLTAEQLRALRSIKKELEQ